MAQIYDRYAEWKGWSGTPMLEVVSERYAEEIRRTNIKPGSNILEIGFGNGAFLDWARGSYKVCGLEILQELVDSAGTRGHLVFNGALENNVSRLPSPFDLVVMFDVMEHLRFDQIVQYLRLIKSILAPTGKLLMRVPNGLSFAGMVHQHGDITHLSVLTPDSVAQLAAITGFEVAFVGNAARSHRSGRSPKKALEKTVAYAMRGLVEVFFGYIYFGKRLPLDADLTFILTCRL